MEYYRTPEGKFKKKIQNGRRGRKAQSKVSSASANNKQPSFKMGKRAIDAEIMNYLRMVASLVERRRVSLNEMVRILRKKMRQHSMDRGRRNLYGAKRDGKKPP